MSTITKEFTKEQLQQIEAAAKEVLWPVVWSEKKAREHFSEKITPKVVLKLARIALASLEAEAVGEVVLGEYDDCGCHPDARVVCIAADGHADWENFKDGTRLYAAPPSPAEIDERDAFNAWNNDENLPIAGVGAKNAAWLAWQARAKLYAPPSPVSVPDEDLLHMAASAIDDLLSNKDRSGAGVWADIPAKLRRAAMLQGADGNSPVMNDYPETLPCPVSLEPGLKFGKGVATKILLEALQRRANYSDEIEVINEVCRDIKDGDFLAAAKINSSSELVNTAYKLPKPIKDHRLNSGPDADDYCVGYQAGWNDSIGEAVICNSPVIPDGWVLVPVEPTAEMISSGIAAHYERSQIQIHDRPAPGPMECAYVAMLAAAPQKEVKP